MAGANTLEFTDSNFDEQVLQSQVPVLVDFWAEWCGPCKALGPIMDEIAEHYGDKVRVGKLDTDANREVSTKYAVSAIPTVLLIQNGEIKEKFVGLRSKQDFINAVDGLTANT